MLLAGPEDPCGVGSMNSKWVFHILSAFHMLLVGPEDPWGVGSMNPKLRVLY